MSVLLGAINSIFGIQIYNILPSFQYYALLVYFIDSAKKKKIVIVGNISKLGKFSVRKFCYKKIK